MIKLLSSYFDKIIEHGLGVIAVLSVISLIISLLWWIVHSLAKVEIAKKMGVKCGALAFFPILRSYLDGKLAEAGDKKRKPEKKPFGNGKLLLVLDLMVNIVGICAVALTFISLMSSLPSLPAELFDRIEEFVLTLPEWLSTLIDETMYLVKPRDAETFSLIVSLAGLVLSLVSNVVLIFFSVAKYKLYAAMAQSHAVWMILVFIASRTLISLPAEFVFDVLLGFTGFLAPKANNTENKETVSDTDSN